MNSIKSIFKLLLSSVIILLFSNSSFAQVNYDKGRMIINGIQLLQDSEDESAYYYLPDYPRISINEAGNFEIMCIKYIGQDGRASGGLFHALIQFDLPDEVLKGIEKELQKQVGGARIVGPVPLRQVLKDGEEGIAGFKIVSSILTDNEGENAFTSNIITSGHAPLLPGSKAAIAAKLNQEGATLLWESLQGETSDVSVVVNGYYEAKVKAYNAIITAEMMNIYEHFSQFYSFQEGFTKNQLRDISDEMLQKQVINIEVFDRSKGLGVKTDDIEAILNIVTDKLIENMFDSKTGWSKQPEKETAVEKGQIKGRQKRGWFSNVFGGARNEKYVSDNQLVIKNKKDVKINKFYLNLSKSTSIKVPVFSSGNISGLYQTLQEDKGDKYFRVVNLEDVDFAKRDIIFQIDGNYIESFNKILNSVTVTFKKTYNTSHDDVTRDILFLRSDLSNGISYKSITYPRVGIKGIEWLDYQYRINWNLNFAGGNKNIHIPDEENKWLESNEASITLNPPFIKRMVQLDADRSVFKDLGIKTCTIQFFVILNGEAISQKQLILSDGDLENTTKFNLYHDINEPVVYQATWYKSSEKIQGEAIPLEGDYIFLIPPQQ